MSLTPPSSHTGGTVADITSDDGSIDVTNGTGPDVDLAVVTGLPRGWTQTGTPAAAVADDGTQSTTVKPTGVVVTQDAANEGYFMEIGFGVFSEPSSASAAFTADGGAGGTVALDAGGLLVVGFQGLPAADPHSAGALYTTTGALMVSAG